MHVGADDLATVLRERNRLREQVTRMERDNKEMLRRVEQGGQVCWFAIGEQLEGDEGHLSCAEGCCMRLLGAHMLQRAGQSGRCVVSRLLKHHWGHGAHFK